MAYTKQTWTDDVSAVTGARMTHIEDGIYANSTNIDTINNNVNPSGTATTTQTDFTEGQLTQKLGLKYIKMKGQTSQYTTTGKNLLGLIDGTYTQGTITAVVKNGTITLNGTASSNTFLDISTENYDLIVGTAYTITINNPVATTNSGDIRFRTESSGSYDVYLGNTNASRTITLESNDDLGNKITLKIASGVALTNFKLTPMIEKSSTATSYEPYTAGVSPNPSYPQDVINVTGLNTINVSNSDNTITKAFTINLGNIELCKIGNYQDYIYKNNGKWYIHKEIGKKTVTNGDDFSLYYQHVGNNVYQYRTAYNYLINAKLNPDPFNIEDIAYSNYFAKKNGLNNLNNYYFTITGNGALAINTPYASINSLKTWLAGIDLKFYYELATATDTEITDTTLIKQLNKLDKIGLYDISNISQDNSDMKMLLDFTICNDNYNGLREFIRA